MANTGKDFEREIRKSLSDTDCFWFRIQDTSDMQRFVQVAVVEKQPGDFFAVWDGLPILIECKTSRRETSFPLYYYPKNHAKKPNIKKHQLKAAENIGCHGGAGIFLIRHGKPHQKRVWAVTPNNVRTMYKTYNSYVSWAWFDENAFELKKKHKPLRWDIKTLFIKIATGDIK